jgi:hypothetical protein
MKRHLTLPLLLLATLGILMSFAAEAQAHATQTKTCTGCHARSAAVIVSAVQTANNGVNATYNVTVNNPYGQNAWAVFSGTTKSAGAAGSGSTAVVLPVGKTYTVFGVSGNGAGTEGYASISVSPVGAVPTAPAPPVISASYPVSTSSVTISWPAVTGATSYDYQVGTGAVINTAATSVTLTGLAAGTTTFKVRSANTGGASAYSSASIIYSAPTIPAAPIVSPTYSVTTSTVTISWPAVSGATSYDYQVGTGLVTNTTATSVTVVGIALGTTSFKVRSANTAGASAYSSASIIYSAATSIPAVPTLSTTYPTSTGSVVISWTPVAGAATYDYQLATGAILSTTATSITLSGLTPGTTAFKLRATNAVGSSAYRAASIVYTLPAAPTAPVLASTQTATNGSVTISWAAVSGATSYSYQLGSGPTLSTTSTSVTLNGLAVGTTGFMLRAANAGGLSAWTSTSIISVQAIPASPVLPASFDTLDGSVTISWATIPGATSYQYQVGTDPIVTTTLTSVTLTALPVGTTAFNVRAANGSGTSAFAPTSINYAPPAPATPVLAAIYGTPNDQVTIAWAPVPGATAYQYQVESGAVVQTTSTQVTLSGLALGSTSFALRACGNGGTGWWTTTTVVSAPPVLRVRSLKSATKRRVTLSSSALGALPAGSRASITLYIKSTGSRKYRAYRYAAVWSESAGSFVFTKHIRAPKAGKAYFVIRCAGASVRSRNFTIRR